jgi:hypothetical protein
LKSPTIKNQINPSLFAGVLKAIGFDDSPHEHRRAERGCQTFAIQNDEKDRKGHMRFFSKSRSACLEWEQQNLQAH